MWVSDLGNTGFSDDSGTVFSYYRMCSHTMERVLILWSVFSYYRMCSLVTLAFLMTPVRKKKGRKKRKKKGGIKRVDVFL